MSTTKAKPAKPARPYTKMTSAELAEATREFDKPADLKQWREMTPDERARWERVKRGGSRRGRPRIGSASGTILVPVSMERSLLERMDAYAARLGLKRSSLVVMAVERLMKEGEAEPGRAAKARRGKAA